MPIHQEQNIDYMHEEGNCDAERKKKGRQKFQRI
jgi:hypothetical protein